MIKEFNYNFNELDIKPKDIEELLGFENGDVPEPFPEIIKHAINEAPKYTNIKGGYKYFETFKTNALKETIKVNHQIFSPSKVVVTQLKHATSCALFLCTAGKEISEYSKQLEMEGELLLSYVFDVTGSIAVDKAMDKIQNELENDFDKKGLRISDRYSPGYCEWSVAEQQKLFSLLPENFCGISLSDSSLMTPIKSVSGIIGIGTKLERKGYQCHWCNDKNCIYGRIKRQKKI